jgi:hypothetical protein
MLTTLPASRVAPKKGVLVGFRSHLQAPLSRERDRIRAEMLHIQGMIPLLMKQRNGGRWTSEERAMLRQQLHSLTSLFPYLLVMVAPGSFFLLPMLAWWLDRRRCRRSDRAPQAGRTAAG